MMAPAAPIKRPPVLRQDSDFLPAALEILETPPAPNKIAFLLAICGFVVIHVALALLVPKTLIAMITGGPRVPSAQPPASSPLEPTGRS